MKEISGVQTSMGATLAALLFIAGAARAQEHVFYTSLDGTRLAADLYGSSARGVVLAHGGRFTKESWSKQARAMAAAGYRVLAVDFRGYGQGSVTADWKRYPDILAAVRYLHAEGVKTVSIVGASMGGEAAADAVAAAKPGEIERLVLLGSNGNDRPDLLAVRKLFIVSREDTSGDGPRLPGIRAAFDKAPQPKKLVILDGAAHAQFIFDTDQGERAMREIMEFLAEP